MTRAAKAVIDLAALRHNLQRARTVDPDAEQYAVIKANAYGHGMVPVAQALNQADGFCVSCLEEAQELRAAGITKPILLLEGFFQPGELTEIQRLDLEVVIHHPAQLDALEQAATQLSLDDPATRPIVVWLKVDTGMHRLGFGGDAVEQAWQRLKACPLVVQQPRLMTHLANADDLHDSTTQKQLELFAGVLANESVVRSIANSAGILGWVASHAEVDRPGIMLYGVSPFLHETGAARKLQPVMTLQSELIAVNTFRHGDAVGYGGSWVCPEDMAIGVVGIGYGDGYPRHAAPGTPVLVNGQRVPLVGRVSMDMITVDLRALPRAGIGDPVILWGAGLPAEEIAESAGTIAYELFCGVTNRVPRHYQNA